MRDHAPVGANVLLKRPCQREGATERSDGEPVCSAFPQFEHFATNILSEASIILDLSYSLEDSCPVDDLAFYESG